MTITPAQQRALDTIREQGGEVVWQDGTINGNVLRSLATKGLIVPARVFTTREGYTRNVYSIREGRST